MTVIAFMLALPFHDDVAVQWPIAVACAGVVTMAASGLFHSWQRCPKIVDTPRRTRVEAAGLADRPPHNGGRPLSRRDQRKLRGSADSTG